MAEEKKSSPTKLEILKIRINYHLQLATIFAFLIFTGTLVLGSTAQILISSGLTYPENIRTGQSLLLGLGAFVSLLEVYWANKYYEKLISLVENERH